MTRHERLIRRLEQVWFDCYLRELRRGWRWRSDGRGRRRRVVETPKRKRGGE
jgi:hypothetical protein